MPGWFGGLIGDGDTSNPKGPSYTEASGAISEGGGGGITVVETDPVSAVDAVAATGTFTIG